MPQFRKKPVVIEAVLWNGIAFDLPLHSWLVHAVADGVMRREGSVMLIHAQGGTVAAMPGDWIICGVQGELYPCKPDIFAATYEAV